MIENNTIVIIQARTSSTRLPAKVLLPIAGTPIAVLAAQRAMNTGKKVIVATSNHPSDDALEDILHSSGIDYFRGDLNNVLSRFVEALTDYHENTLVFRLTADNVFPDGALLDTMEKAFLEKDLDYLICNGELSKVPYGVSAELTYLKHLREAANFCKDRYNQEHVTPYIREKFGETAFQASLENGLGLLRCTIDTFDDYHKVARIFRRIDNPAQVSLDGLVQLLKKHSNAKENKTNQNHKLIIGTAQLGMEYGVHNTTGKPSFEASEQLLTHAAANGVHYFDTARSYGDSERIIGNAFSDNMDRDICIITKLAHFEKQYDKSQSAETILKEVDSSILESLINLKKKSLDVLLLHDARYLEDWEGLIWERIKHIKRIGLINSIGVSIQSTEELKKALKYDEITYFQMPYNILDWRWDEHLRLIECEKEKRDISFHVRSVFLQGLILDNHPMNWQKAHVNDYNNAQEWLSKTAIQCQRESLADLCIAYVKAQNWIDGVVVGMETIDQLRDNLYSFSRPNLTHEQVDFIKGTRPKLLEKTLNPSMWDKDKNENR